MENQIREAFERTFPFFAGASGSFFDTVLRESQHCTFKEGVTVYTEGEPCSGIGFALSGQVRVFKVGDNGREITLYRVGPGETCVLGASSILSSRPYPAKAMTAKEASFIVLPAEEFRRLMSSSPEMRSFVFRLINERLTAIMGLLEDVVFGRMDERIKGYLLLKAEGGRLRTTHQTIANDLGTSREVVSRLLKDFEKRGMVALSRNMIELLDT